MKKLMIAAAVAAMVGGAFATCGDDDPSEDCATVWKFKASVKTTAVKNTQMKDECGDKYGVCYRVTGSQTVEGVVVNCDCDCIEDMGSEAETQWFLWDKKAGWAAASAGIYQTTDTSIKVQQILLNRLDKKGNKAEGAFHISIAKTPVETTLAYDYEFEVVAAGIGTYDVKNDRVSKLSGNFAGVMAAPAFKCGMYLWGLCDYEAYDVEAEDVDGDMAGTVAYGSWSLTYNKKLSATASGLSSLGIPSWALKLIK